MTPAEKIIIDRITKILEANGWKVVAIDTRGENLELTIQKPKKA